MKNKLAILIVGLVMSAATLSAQAKYDYGKDSVNCVTNLFHYQQFTKQKLYDDALAPWEKLIGMCPEVRKSLYTTGAKMLRSLHKKEADEAKKEELLTKLMMLYDTRLEVLENNSTFGKRGYVLGLKGVDMYKYYPDKIEESMAILKESIDIQKNKSKASVLSSYFSAIYNGFKAEKVPVDVLLSEYIVVSDIINHNLNSLKPGEEKVDRKIANFKKTKDNIDTYFIAVAECDDIVKLYTEKISADPENLELNKKALSILDRKQCDDAEIFMQVTEFVHGKEPSAKSASALGRMYLKKEDVDKALTFFDQAVELCGDCSDKETFLKNAGLINGSKGRHGKASQIAGELLKLNPNSGTAYILKGDAVKSKYKSCDDGKMGSKSVFWKAADYYSKAISVDPDDKVKDAARKKLNSCKNQYPTKEDLFFVGLKAGDSYTVPCTGETTTIRQSN